MRPLIAERRQKKRGGGNRRPPHPPHFLSSRLRRGLATTNTTTRTKNTTTTTTIHIPRHQIDRLVADDVTRAKTAALMTGFFRLRRAACHDDHNAHARPRARRHKG